MKKRIILTLKIISLLLILPLLGIAFAPPMKINAQCTSATGSQIQVENGLISTINVSNFGASAAANVACITGQRASIPQFSIQTYPKIRRDYFEQARSTFSPITISGSRTQTVDCDPAIIDLCSR